MSGDIDRVARAIFYAHKATGPRATSRRPGEPPFTHRLANSDDLDGWDDVSRRYIEMAQAAVYALRKPTAAQEIAAISFNAAADVAREIYTAMIDAILEEKP